MAVPAFLLSKVPLGALKAILSPAIAPESVPPLSVAAVVPSYTLLAAVIVATVQGLAVMSAIALDVADPRV